MFRLSIQPCLVTHLTLLGLGFGVLSQAGGADVDAWLKWRNGDELDGRVVEGSDTSLRWNAEPFAEPLDIEIEQLEGIRFSTANRERDRSESQFRVLMVNGDRLDGTITEITRDAITMTCKPFPEPITIRRDAIERIINARGTHLRYDGPDDLGDWSSLGRDRKPTEWFTDLRGEFATHQWSGDLFREIEFPERMELRFTALFPQGKPNLEIGLLRDPHLGPMIETWDDYLVLTHKTQFTPVLELTEDTKKLDFRLFWNQEAGEVRLCEPSGKLLASLDDAFVQPRDVLWKKRSRDPKVRGFFILNRTPEIKLTTLTVREWDGGTIPVIDLEQPRAHIRGRDVRFKTSDILLEKGSRNLSVGGDQVSIFDLNELILSPRPDADEIEARTDTTRVAWFAGSTTSGDFQRIGANELVIKPDWASQPVRVTLDDAKELRFPEFKAPIHKGNDKLVGRDLSLRGSVKALQEDATSTLIGWKVPGAKSATPLAKEAEVEITRDPYPATKGDLTAIIGRARIYLVNGEVLVGDLISIKPDVVVANSPVTGRIEILANRIRAIDIGSAGRVLTGFRDPEWEEIEETEDDVVSTPDKVNLKGGSFGNPSLLLGDSIKFDAEWKRSYGAMTLRLFASSPQDNTPSTDIIIAAQGNRLFIGKLKASGAFSFSGDQIPISGNSANFEIRTLPEEVEVIVNGKSSLTVSVDPEKASGNGIYFKMGGGWQGWNQADNEIEITNFLIDRSYGSLPRRVIDPTAKKHALMVPRTLRDEEPTHLLIAPNGDLLRGRLESAAGENVIFSSKTRTLDIPRNRVSAIVWLRQPVEEEESEEIAESEEKVENTEEENDARITGGELIDLTKRSPEDLEDYELFDVTHQFVMMNGSRLHLAADRVEENRFVGKSALLGECRVSIENVRELKRGPAIPAHTIPDTDIAGYAGWQLEYTPDPVIPSGSNAPTSPLVGNPAPPFELTMLDDSKFDLTDYEGKVVVLDFWATWCGPCIKAMPDVMTVVNAFPDGVVAFCAVNQAETPAIISEFLKNRDWEDTPVALDFDMKVSNDYGVEGIPHTVVIAPDGNVSWVHSGYAENLKEELFNAIRATLKP